MVGRPLDQVHITSVKTRKVTATRGEAEAVYDLPESATGNDNWLEYRYADGRWRVDDCNLTIGGSSSQASGGTTASASNTSASAGSSPASSGPSSPAASSSATDRSATGSSSASS
jgi:hypothetical protein